jgi:hypothetical protein
VVRRYKQLKWHAAVVLGALVATALAPAPARAEGLFDFLFNGPQDRQAPPPPAEHTEPSAPVTPVPLGPESVRQGGGGIGRVIAYCVRLCDGQHFPLAHMANATPVETCRAMCPASKTKVFFGSGIGSAVAKDGTRYTNLDTAFAYRKQLVAKCTCNGKNAFGLARFGVSNDPTLRPGDIVATKQGLMAYSGKNGKTAAFKPVDHSTVAAELNSVTSRVEVNRRSEPPPAEVDPGTIAVPQTAPPPVNFGANMRGSIVR